MNEDYGLIKEIKDRIADLPVGYISEKTINGKKQYYRQWRENGKLTGKYISAEELDSIRGQIEARKQLEEELDCLLFERINHTITLTDSQ